MRKFVKSTASLVCICAVVAVMLAVTNAITAPIIKKNEAAAANESLLLIMPDGEGFEEIDVSTYTLPATVSTVYKTNNGGYVFKLETTGYSSGLVIMCGVYADGTVSGATCLASTETLGYEKTYGKNFDGKNAEAVDAVDTVSGATKTTGAYRSAVRDALNAAIILSGGTVDIRTEEEILADHLSEALPAAEGKFTKLFITEILESIDAIYAADNDTGFVCVVSEQYVAVDINGNVISDVDEVLSASVSTEIQKMLTSTQTELDLTVYEGLPKAVLSASVTASGNYVLEMRAAGYGINGGNDYHPASGEYIYIRISMTSAGKIIDCLTLSEEETDGIGSACAEESFYGQFIGKTEETYKQIDAISGATMTTNGYLTAIQRAFDAVKILERGEAS